MRRTLFLVVLALSPCLAFLLPEKPARADQWQVLSPEEAARARAGLRPGSLLVLHCSACRDGVQVMRVVEATAEQWSFDRGQRVLRVRCERLLESAEAFAVGSYSASKAVFRAPARGHAIAEEEVDLAYAYVQRGPNRFACFALELGLPTSGVIPELTLPDAAWRVVARPPLAKTVAVSVPIEKPAPKAVAKPAPKAIAKPAAEPVAEPAAAPRTPTRPRRGRTASF